jgi:hypothetical protein
VHRLAEDLAAFQAQLLITMIAFVLQRKGLRDEIQPIKVVAITDIQLEGILVLGF